MDRKTTLYTIFGFLFGTLLTLIITRTHYQRVVAEFRDQNNNQTSEKRGEEIGIKAKTMVEIDQMASELEKRSGSDLDKTFLRIMVPYHIGAIAMSEEVIKRGEHPELKKMAEEIVAQQTKEVEQLQVWQKQWDYEKP